MVFCVDATVCKIDWDSVDCRSRSCCVASSANRVGSDKSAMQEARHKGSGRAVISAASITQQSIQLLQQSAGRGTDSFHKGGFCVVLDKLTVTKAVAAQHLLILGKTGRQSRLLHPLETRVHAVLGTSNAALQGVVGRTSLPNKPEVRHLAVGAAT